MHQDGLRDGDFVFLDGRLCLLLHTYICAIDPETSGHTRSMLSLIWLRAKLRRASSGSDRKPTRPATDDMLAMRSGRDCQDEAGEPKRQASSG